MQKDETKQSEMKSDAMGKDEVKQDSSGNDNMKHDQMTEGKKQKKAHKSKEKSNEDAMGKDEMNHSDNVKQSDSMQKRRNAALSLNGALAYPNATQPKLEPESQNFRPQNSKEK